jgi:uncharacterized protein
VIADTQPAASALARYRAGAERGELLLTNCADCGRYSFYPRARCPYCLSAATRLVPASGRGTIHAFTVVHRAPTREFSDDVPYTLAMVELEEGPRMLARVLPGSELRVDQAVAVKFVETPAGVLPYFQVDSEGANARGRAS